MSKNVVKLAKKYVSSCEFRFDNETKMASLTNQRRQQSFFLSDRLGQPVLKVGLE